MAEHFLYIYGIESRIQFEKVRTGVEKQSKRPSFLRANAVKLGTLCRPVFGKSHG
jgi:hypothetical protein